VKVKIEAEGTEYSDFKRVLQIAICQHDRVLAWVSPTGCLMVYPVGATLPMAKVQEMATSRLANFCRQWLSVQKARFAMCGDEAAEMIPGWRVESTDPRYGALLEIKACWIGKEVGKRITEVDRSDPAVNAVEKSGS